MRSDGLLDRFELFTAPAVIAAHANYPTVGFRQKDVRFIIDLFTDWVSYSLEDSILPLKNTQILRYLLKLVTDGYAKRTIHKGVPRYRLTRVGLVEMITRVVRKRFFNHPSFFYFRFYFIQNYKTRIADLIRNEGKQFPLSYKLEIDSLLNGKEMLEIEIKETEKDIIRLKNWVSEGERACEYARQLYGRKLSHSAIAEEMERRYPYNLNSQRPLSELLSEIPPDIGAWELSYGAQMRSQHIWAPSLAIITSHHNELKKLLRSLC